MKIAIMGARDSVNKIYRVLSKENPDIEFIKYSEDEIESLILKSKNMQPDVDGIFFTGIGVYSKIASTIKFEQPLVYTERGPIGIIKALWEFSMEHEDIRNMKIALDIIDEKDLTDVLNEFDISVKNYTIQRYLPSKNEKDYIDYYIEKFKEKEIDYVFTSFAHVYNCLKKINIPVYRIQATNMDIKNKFIKLLDNIELKNIKKRVVQVQIIQVIEDSHRNTKNIIRQIALEEKLLIYSKEIEAMMQTISPYEYLIISNKGSFLNSDNISSLYKIVDDCKVKNIKLGLGVGEGDTLFKSETHARNALRKSILENQGDIYFYDGETVTGPIMKKGQIEYKNFVDEKILNLSKEIGISYQYIEKINSIINKLGRDEFTSQELSEILLISERSINRLLKKIIDKGYGKEVGLENSLGAGRPRRKIKISLK